MKAIILLKLYKLRDDIKTVGFMTVLTLIMIMVFGSMNYSPQDVKLGYIDEDQTEVSRLVLKALNEAEGYKFTEVTLEEGKELVKDGDLKGAFYIEEGFMEDALSGSVNVKRLLVSENMENMRMDSLLFAALNKGVTDYEIIHALSGVVGQFNSETNIGLTIEGTIDEHWEYKQPVTITETSLKDETEYSAMKHSIVGFSLFFAMFTIVFGVSDILQEKENHTWPRQLVSPISKLEILSGNLLMTFIIGFIQVSLMFLVSKYLFKIGWVGSMVHLVILIAAFVFCVTALGMMLSNFVKTMGQLSAISPVLITGTAMLGGCFWPLEIVTAKPLLFLSLFTPQRWAISAIEKVVIHGYGIEDILLNIAILVGMGLFYLGLGTFLLEKKSA